MPRLNMTTTALALATTLAIGCVTTATPPKAPTAKPIAKTSDAPPPSAKKAPAAVTAVDARDLFKASPSVEERTTLARRIEGWKESGDHDTLVRRATDELALGRLAAAERSFREAMRQRPDSTDALLGVAEISLRRRQPDRALDLLANVQEIMRGRDENPAELVTRYRFLRAMTLIGRGDRADGNRELNDLIEENTTLLAAYGALAGSYLEAKKEDAAQFIAQRGLDRGGDDPALYNILGVVAERSGKTSEADTWYAKALAVAPTFVPAIINRSKIKLAKDDASGAAEDLVKALEFAPEDTDALVTLGVAHRRLKAIDDARRDFQRAIDIDPECAAARFNLGVLMAEDLRQPGAALRLFHEVIQTRDSDTAVKDRARAYIGEIENGQEF